MRSSGTERLIDAALYLFLAVFTFIVVYPIYLMVITSFKTIMDVSTHPFGLPAKFYMGGWQRVLELSHFTTYYLNSLVVTGVSLGLILIVSTLASFALSRYRFRLNRPIYFFFLLGMTIPLRLAILNLVRTIQAIHMFDTLTGLILIYTAMGIPYAVFIITAFMSEVPTALLEAARLDGCTDMQLLMKVVGPLARPALATAAIYNFIPIWNDFYFPLIFIRSDGNKTLPLGTAIFFGQHQTDWPTAFAALTMAVIPSLIFYLLMSKHFIKGLTAGAVKG